MPSATYDDTNGLHVNGEISNVVQRVKNEALTVGEALYLGFPDKHGNFMDEEEKRRLGLGANVSQHPVEKPYSICLREVPVTVERRSYYPKEGDALLDPGTARVNIAPSNESPEGTTQDNWAKKHATQTVVQQHTDYFDPDHDGIIWPLDTYRSCRAWGWAIPLCLFATFIINVNLSYATAPSWIPDPFFRIHIKNMHKNKHGSDSMTYDSEGRFRPQNFEDMFAKYDRGHKGGLDLRDLARMLKGQRMAMDLFGWSAAFFEWLAVYLLLWPDDGVMRKEDIRRIFDGSIFQYKADEYAKKQRRKNAGKRNLSNKAT